MHQAHRSRREAEHAFAGGLLDRRAPVFELLVGEGVDVGAGRQVLEGLLVDGQHVRRLHPRNVVRLVFCTHVGQVHECWRESSIPELLDHWRQVLQIAGLDERVEVSVHTANQTDGDFAGLLLRGHTVVERADRFGDVVSLDWCVFEDDVLHLGLLFDRTELG